MSTFIPVKAEEWAKMVQSISIAADLLVENKRLKDELKRLRRAGDAMAERLEDDGETHPESDAWHDARNGGAK